MPATDPGDIATDGVGAGPAFGFERIRTLASPRLAAALAGRLGRVV